jgi:hypothetical protein
VIPRTREAKSGVAAPTRPVSSLAVLPTMHELVQKHHQHFDYMRRASACGKQGDPGSGDHQPRALMGGNPLT